MKVESMVYSLVLYLLMFEVVNFTINMYIENSSIRDKNIKSLLQKCVYDLIIIFILFILTTIR